MDIRKLVSQSVVWLEQTTLVTPCKDGFYKIAVPLVDHFNDGLEIYVREREGQVDITDDGYIVSNLEKCGVVVSEGSEQREYIKRIIRKNDLELRNDEIWAHTTVDKFPVVALTVFQAMLTVDALYDVGLVRKPEVEPALN